MVDVDSYPETGSFLAGWGNFMPQLAKLILVSHAWLVSLALPDSGPPSPESYGLGVSEYAPNPMAQHT
jgi:hypothetical protein